MILTNKIAKITISFIRKNLSTSEEELEKIDYGIKVLVSNFFKLVILFSTAYFLGILKYTALAVIAFGIIRSFACGVHANSTLQCIIINYVWFFGNVYIAKFHPLSTLALFIILLISIVLFYFYAPADTAERPLINKNLRKALKISSIFTALIFFVICLFINNSIYKTIIIYSIFQESLAVTPLFYKLLGKTYRNYSNIDL